jgi:glycolate oxidase
MQVFKKINAFDLDFFEDVVGKNFIYSDPEAISNYSKDETTDETLFSSPEVVIKPRTVEEIRKIMKYCYQNNIPVTPRGAGSGLSGGSIPIYGGVVLSFENMNKILEIDEKNMIVVVEPGVITNEINKKLKPYKLFYAGYPMSLETCQIGGNIAENAGGGKAVKYGVTSNYVRGIEFVTASGDLLCFGGKTHKDVSSYDIIHLIVGSEGTLGIVTKIFLKIIPLPKERTLLLAPFNDLSAALNLPTIIFCEMGLMPTSIEIMNRQSLQYAYELSKNSYPYPESPCHILVEIDDNYEESLYKLYTSIGKRMLKENALDVFVADNLLAIEEMWKIRRTIPEALFLFLPDAINEDISVPINRTKDLVDVIKDIGTKYNLVCPIYGHLGDGNLHVTLSPRDKDLWKDKIPKIIYELYKSVVTMGGCLSGEHGIGCKRKDYIPIFYSPEEISLLRKIKYVFDEKGILNPGKIFP